MTNTTILQPIRFVYDFRLWLQDSAWTALGITPGERSRMPTIPLGFTLEVWHGPVRRWLLRESAKGLAIERTVSLYDDDDWMMDDFTIWSHALSDNASGFTSACLYLPSHRSKRAGEANFEIVFACTGGHDLADRAGCSLPVEDIDYWTKRQALFKISVPFLSNALTREVREQMFSDLESTLAPSEEDVDWPCYIRAPGRDKYEHANAELGYSWRLVIHDLRSREIGRVEQVNPEATAVRLDDGRRLLAPPAVVERREEDGRVTPHVGELVVVTLEDSSTLVHRMWLTGSND